MQELIKLILEFFVLILGIPVGNFSKTNERRVERWADMVQANNNIKFDWSFD